MVKQMGNHYTVQILNDKEFDSLPYRGISDSLGIADREKGLAFVRKTGIKEFDEATLHHEIDHLVEKYGTHQDEYGIAHKKVFKDIIAPYILPIVASILAPGLGGLLGIGSTMSAGIGGGLGKIAADLGTGKKFNPLGTALSAVGGGLVGKGMGVGLTAAKEAGKGFLGQTVGGLLGTAPTSSVAGTAGILGQGGKLLGMGAGSLSPLGSVTYPAGTPVGVTNMGNFSRFPGESVKGLMSASLSTAPQTLGIGQSILGSAIGSGIGSSLASVGKTATAPGSIDPTMGLPAASGQGLAPSAKTAFQSAMNIPAAAIQAPAEVASKTGVLSRLGKQAGELVTAQNLLGGGLVLGSTMGKQPEFEPIDIESIRTSLLSGQGISPLGQQARKQLSSIMSAKPGEIYPTGTDPYYQSAFRQIEKSYAEAQKSLAKRYNMIDPNYQQNGEYQLLAQRLDQELAGVKSDYSIQEEQRRFELGRTQQYQAIQQALQVDDATMQELIGVTGLSVDQAAKKYAVATADVDEIRKALGGLGGQLMIGGK